MTTISNLGLAMFTVSDVDKAIAFYTERLGFELRADVTFGPNNDMRWVEVAPPGSTARLALNEPMNSQPGHGSIGVEATDLRGEHARISAFGDVDIDQIFEQPGAPQMFMLRDPDGNHIVVVTPPDQR